MKTASPARDSASLATPPLPPITERKKGVEMGIKKKFLSNSYLLQLCQPPPPPLLQGKRLRRGQSSGSTCVGPAPPATTHIPSLCPAAAFNTLNVLLYVAEAYDGF